MLAFLLSTLMACSSTTMKARDAAYEDCSKSYSGRDLMACKEGARYRFNGNKHDRSDYYCRKLQPYNTSACYRGVENFDNQYKKESMLGKATGEVESSALAVNQESNSSSKESISNETEMMSVEKSAVSI